MTGDTKNMKKQEFLAQLRSRLAWLPSEDAEERVQFFEEMIDDYVEDGVPEEEAIEKIGSVDEIVAVVTSEIPLTKIVREKIKPKESVSTGKVIFLILGFPIWFPLVIALFSIILALFIVLWSIVICFVAVDVALFAGVLASIVAMIYCFAVGEWATGLLMGGCALLCAGFTFLTFALCGLLAKGSLKQMKGFGHAMKALFIGKEHRQ